MEKNFYYTILGVNPDATKEEIESRYRDLIKKYHPDSGTTNDAMFKLLTEARETLTDDVKRKAYDESQREPGQTNGNTYTDAAHSYTSGNTYANGGTYTNGSTYADGNAYGREGTYYDQENSGQQGGYGSGGGPSVLSFNTYILGLDTAQLLIIQVLLLFFAVKALVAKYGYSSFMEYVDIISLLMWVSLAVQMVLKGGGIVKSLFFLIGSLFGIALVGQTLITVLHLSERWQGVLIAVVMVTFPFITYAGMFFEALSIFKLMPHLGLFRKLTACLGVICGLLLVITCLVEYPAMYRFGYQDAVRTAAVHERKKEKEAYIADVKNRNLPESVSTGSAVSEGGQISKDTVIKTTVTYDVIKNHAKSQVDGTVYFYPFEYMTGDKAMEYLEFVSDRSYEYDAKKEQYEFCVIRYGLYGGLGENEGYESISRGEVRVKTELEPINEEYRDGYYVDGQLLQAQTDEESFGNDGFIVLTLPKGFHDYYFYINVGSSNGLYINVNEYYAE